MELTRHALQTIALLPALAIAGSRDVRILRWQSWDLTPQVSLTRCEIARVDGSQLFSLDHTREMLASADVIVRAVARRPATQEEASRASPPFPYQFPYRHGQGTIAFAVLELLKGTAVPDTIIISGDLTDAPDSNSDSVPYVHVRDDGLHGSCFAFRYQRGGAFLLVLKRDSEGRLSPYWNAEMPTNEQLRDDKDPWLKWVREQLRSRR